MTTNSVSSSVFSLASATPVSVVTTTETFAPATVNGAVFSGVVGDNTNGNPANPNAGTFTLCNLSTLPSSTKPTCAAPNGGTVTLLGGQEDINVNSTKTFLIDTATTVTDTTTPTSVFDINGVSVRGIDTVRAAVAEQGFDAADRFGRRLLDAGPDGGAQDRTPGDPLWLEGYGYWSQTGASQAFPGSNASGSGINGGLDYAFPGGFRLGAAADYDSAGIDEGPVGEHASLALTQVGLYGGWRMGPLFAAVSGTYGWGSATTTVTPPGVGETALSRFDPSAATLSAEAGERLAERGWSLSPTLGAAWTHLQSGGFTETGSALDLTGSDQGYNRYKGWAGLALETTLGGDGGDGALTLRAYGRALALGGDDVLRLPVSFVGSPTPLDITGPDTGSFGGDLPARPRPPGLRRLRRPAAGALQFPDRVGGAGREVLTRDRNKNSSPPCNLARRVRPTSSANRRVLTPS